MKFCFIIIVFIYMLFIVDLFVDLPDNEVLYPKGQLRMVLVVKFFKLLFALLLL